MPSRHDQIVADQRRRRAADEEEDRDGAEIEQRDPLVIGRQQPAAEGEAVGQVRGRVGNSGSLDGGRAHDGFSGARDLM